MTILRQLQLPADGPVRLRSTPKKLRQAPGEHCTRSSDEGRFRSTEEDRAPPHATLLCSSMRAWRQVCLRPQLLVQTFYGGLAWRSALPA